MKSEERALGETVWVHGAWGIIKTPKGQFDAIITHQCNNGMKSGIIIARGAPAKCWYCEMDVPNSVQSIWLLYNFDSIQAQGGS